ncbi:2-isopropylmalate synthase [Candidatus Woesearchaeota archaeon]|nr:2-isopropylmalate synthase [Candidatus Woesearchaeota archaeon]
MNKFARNPAIVQIFDTTNRDGEQATTGARYGARSKLTISRALARAGVDRIEAGFPVSSQADFHAVQLIAREVRGPMIFGLTKTNPDEIKRTYEAVQDAEYPGIHVFSVMFDPHSLEAYGTTMERVVEESVKGVAYARELLGSRGQIEFSFQNATNSPLDWIVNGYLKMIEAGADVINVPDTVGYTHPDEITTIFAELRRAIPQYVLLSAHCHDDLGNATANSIAAVRAGADIVECTINGIGERAGNAALEEIVMNIIVRKGLLNGRTVRFDTTSLNELSRLVRDHYGMEVQQNKAIVGANAFRHRSGVHQDGMVKGRVYEIMQPAQVGWTGEGFDLTARSGYAGVAQRSGRLGYDTSGLRGLKAQIMLPFKQIADEKGSVGDTDLVWLMDSVFQNGRQRYSLEDMSIRKAEGSDNYHVSVKLVDGSQAPSGSITVSGAVAGKSGNGANGSEEHHGAVEALYSTIDKMVGKGDGWHLISYSPVNIGTGSNATAEVTVILSRDADANPKIIKPFENGARAMYVGRARHEDTLRASAMAYLDAINKMSPQN